jgi:hypothetical protein
MKLTTHPPSAIVKNGWIVPPLLHIPSWHAQEQVYRLRVLESRVVMERFGLKNK